MLNDVKNTVVLRTALALTLDLLGKYSENCYGELVELKLVPGEEPWLSRLGQSQGSLEWQIGNQLPHIRRLRGLYSFGRV